MKIRDLMVRRVATVGPEAPLDRAAREMHERNCGCLVVVDEEMRAIGMVTDRDVCMAAWRSNTPLSMGIVRDAMSHRLYACRPDETLEKAEHLMGLHQVRRLPVVDAEGRLLGLVTLDDLASEARRLESLLAPAVTPQAVGRTLGEIGRPHLVE